MTRAFVFAFLALVALVLAGCVQVTTQPTATATPRPVGVSPTPTFVSTVEPGEGTPTPLPLEGVSKADYVQNCRFQSGNASLECLQRAAVLFGDSALCGEQRTVDARFVCEGLVLEDYQKCLVVRDVEQQSLCLDGVGVAKSDATVCARISATRLDYRLDCLSNVAFKTRDGTVCSRFFVGDVADYRPLCTALTTASPSACAGARESVRDHCYFYYALFSKDEGACKSLSTSDGRLGCSIRVLQYRQVSG